MKHVVSRKKSVIETPSPAGKASVKSPVKSAGAAKKASKTVVASKPEKKTAVSVAAKISVRTVKPSIKRAAPAEPPVKPRSTVAKASKSKVFKVRSERISPVKAAAKNRPASVVKQNAKAERIIVKSKAAVRPSKSKDRNPEQKVAKTTKKVAVKESDGKTATKKPQVVAAAAKTSPIIKVAAKIRAKKSSSVNIVEKLSVKPVKPKSSVSVVKVDRASQSVKENSKAEKKIAKPVKSEAVKQVKKIEIIEAKPQNLPTARMLKKMRAELVISAKANKISARLKNQKIAPVVQLKKPEIVENKEEPTDAPIPAKFKNRKAKPLGSAIFRGKKARYDFKMFALNEVFEAIPAVYIISKRTTDKRKKGHHALICIGETTSILAELKKHRKGKCVKKHSANVVSILPEADEEIRLKIETDLKAAHTVVCGLD